jgi:hypothetical protein
VFHLLAKAYCLFSAATFLERGAFLTGELDEGMAAHLAALTKEGLTTKSIAWGSRSITNEAMTRPRRIGNKYIRTADLPTKGPEHVRNGAQVTAVVEAATFQLRIKAASRHSTGIRRCMVGCKELAYPVMRFSRIVIEREPEPGGINQPYHELVQVLDGLTMMELMNIQDHHGIVRHDCRKA